jgi:hypothetical protein
MNALELDKGLERLRLATSSTADPAAPTSHASSMR